MKVLKAIGLIVTLMACGAQSDPIRPTADVGVSIGTNGVSTSANVGATNGPVTVSVGF